MNINSLKDTLILSFDSSLFFTNIFTMNPQKFFTLNIIAFIGIYALAFICNMLLAIGYGFPFILPMKIFQYSILNCITYCYIVALLFCVLFVVEFILRRKWSKLFPEIKLPKSIKIIHGIFFYTGLLISLSSIAIYTFMVIIKYC